MNQWDLHLIVFPLLYDLESEYRFHEVEKEITRFAGASEIPVFSLTPGFIGRTSRTLWISPHDQHPNELGHRIAAETLYPYLKKVVRNGLTP